MSGHVTAVPRRIDIGAWVRARRKPKDRPPDDVIPMHMHTRPLLIVKTTAGDLPADLVGSCLYHDALVCRYLFIARSELTILSLIYRFGKDELVIPLHEIGPVALRPGLAIKASVALLLVSGVLGPEKGIRIDMEGTGRGADA